jgi:excisionase family DNA binding protein
MTDRNEWTISVPEAGRRYFNLSRNASYAAADRGEIPTVRIGRLRRVPVKAVEQKLEVVSLQSEAQRVVSCGMPHGQTATESIDDLHTAVDAAERADFRGCSHEHRHD